MAKGDANRFQNAVDYRGQQAQDTLNSWRNDVVQPQYNNLWSRFNQAADQAQNDYGTIMGNYQNLINNPVNPQTNFTNEYQGYQNLAGGGGATNVSHMGDIDAAIAGFKNFADTGGFSGQDIENLRARAISPTRAVYANAQANIDRQRALQGGYSPNYTASAAKLARDVSQQVSDANTNANASIATAVQQGKLSGLTGLSNAALGAASAQMQVDQLNNQMKLAGLGGMTDIDKARLAAEFEGRTQQLQAAQGQTSLYGTTPGMANMFGNQVMQTSNQLGQASQLQNQIAQMIINGNFQRSQIPSTFQNVLGNIGSIGGIIGQVGGAFGGAGNLGRIFGGGNLPSRQTVPNTGILPTGLPSPGVTY